MASACRCGWGHHDMTQLPVSLVETSGTSSEDVTTPETWRGVATSRHLRCAFDIVVVVGCAVVAFLVRRGGLPTDGLWLDDAWVATGALHGHLSGLLTVGSAHPGFTGLLMAWHQVGGGTLRSLAVPALVAGIAAAPLLYLGLRSFRYERSICAFLAALLVISDVHVQQSSRVKPYTIDTLAVLALALAIPRLARVRWHWQIALAWMVTALVLGSMSGYLMVATAAAGLILVLHPSSDRLVRVVAVAVQGVGQLALYLAAQRTTDLAELERFMEQAFDGHMTFYPNPLDFAAESLKHLRRVSDVYPGGSATWLSLFALVAVAGLVIASVRGHRRSEALAARVFLVVVAFAFVGSLLGRFPFGPNTRNPLADASSGGRHTLWLLPAVAFGLAAALHRVRRLVTGRVAICRAFDAVLLIAALAVIIDGYGDPTPYPRSGSGSATELIESEIGPRDVVIVAGGGLYSFAVSSRTPLHLAPTPDHMIGFTPVFDDERFHTFGEWSELVGTPGEIRAAVDGAVRVIVYGGFLDRTVGRVAETLRAEGFHEELVMFGNNLVITWSR
jgi:hypothetical protein